MKYLFVILILFTVFSCATVYKLEGSNNSMKVSDEKDFDFELNKDVTTDDDITTSTELDMLNKK